MTPLVRTSLTSFLLLSVGLLSAAKPHTAAAQDKSRVSGPATLALTREFLAVAPKRFNGSPGHAAAENFIKTHFAPEDRDHRLEVDSFTASTPAGLQSMRNLIVKFPGKKDGVIVLVTHYETNWPLRTINFVGANDGACTSALLIEIGLYLRNHPPQGYSVWLVFDDGEEAVKDWSDSDSLYGTRHLAAKWVQDGTVSHIKAVMIADMIGDKDLNILRETQSTPWLSDTLRKAAADTHHSANVFKTSGDELDDHTPFLKRGIPTIDIIDTDYGPHNAATPDGYHHTAQDTIDKISAQSLQISADLFMEMIRLINLR